jgi:hypothetical protein
MFAACGGDNGTVISVFPDTAFVGRTTTVEVTGLDTDWSSGVTVDFGEGVTVTAINVLSPTALQADLDVAASTELGLADVSVSGSDTGAGLLEFLSPVSVELGTFEQGGFGNIVITNLDLLHPFDTTTDEDGNFINLDVTNVGEGVALAVADATPDTIVLSALIDVTATETGEITLSASDGTTPNTTIIASAAVTPRTPIALSPTGTMDITVENNGTLFEITGAELAMLQLRWDSEDAIVPAIDVLPASGKWSEALYLQVFAFSPFVLENRTVDAGEKLYVVASDFFGGGFPATFSTRTIPLTGVTPVVDTGSNDTAATAQTANGTIVQFDGTLSDESDVDCFSVTTTVNQRIHVFTTDENGATNTAVTVFDINDNTQLEPAQSSDDFGFPEDVLTQALAVPGSRSVCISGPTSQFAEPNPPNAPYKAFVVIEN